MFCEAEGYCARDIMQSHLAPSICSPRAIEHYYATQFESSMWHRLLLLASKFGGGTADLVQLQVYSMFVSCVEVKVLCHLHHCAETAPSSLWCLHVALSFVVRHVCMGYHHLVLSLYCC